MIPAYDDKNAQERKIKIYVLLVTFITCLISSLITLSSTNTDDIYIDKLELLTRSQFLQCRQYKLAEKLGETLFYEKEKDSQRYKKNDFTYPDSNYVNSRKFEYFYDPEITGDQSDGRIKKRKLELKEWYERINNYLVLGWVHRFFFQWKIIF